MSKAQHTPDVCRHGVRHPHQCEDCLHGPSDSAMVAALMTACLNVWHAIGRQGAAHRAHVLSREYEECQEAIGQAGPRLHLQVAETAAERDRLRAQVAALEADAARYRWLRDNTATYTHADVPLQLIVQEHHPVHQTHGATGYRAGLDAAVDAVISRATGGAS